MISVLFLLALAVVCLDAARVDLRERRLPNRHTFTIAVVVGSLLAAWQSDFTGSRPWWWPALAVSVVHLGLALLPARVLGMGDAKLIAAISPLMSWWNALALWLLISYASAACWGLILMKLSRNSRIPFGPHLIAAAMAVVVGQFARVALAYCR
ncbi:MAG: hypothetical protein RL441_607 [Actinomycetota bacterium]